MPKQLEIKYIEDLTDNLIGTHNLHLVASDIQKWERYLAHVYQILLSSKALLEMTPETFGRIVGNIGEDIVTKAQDVPPFLQGLGYTDGMSILRITAATLLTFVIFDRLNPEVKSSTYKPSRFVIQAV